MLTRCFDRASARLLLGALALVTCGSSLAQIYVGASGNNGPVVLSNFPSTETPVVLIEAPVQRSAAQPVVSTPARLSAAQQSTLRLPAAPAPLRQLVDEVAAQVRISPELLHAVIAAESRYNPRAVSPRGAIGLMQLMPSTATRFGARDPFAERENVLAGASYLKWLMALFRNDLELVLAAYNAGEQAVLDAGSKIPPYRETQAYVPRVLAYLRCASSATCRPV